MPSNSLSLAGEGSSAGGIVFDKSGARAFWEICPATTSWPSNRVVHDLNQQAGLFTSIGFGYPTPRFQNNILLSRGEVFDPERWRAGTAGSSSGMWWRKLLGYILGFWECKRKWLIKVTVANDQTNDFSIHIKIIHFSQWPLLWRGFAGTSSFGLHCFCCGIGL